MFRNDLFSSLYLPQLVFDLFILVLSLFTFFALVLVFQRFIRKHCLQFLGHVVNSFVFVADFPLGKVTGEATIGHGKPHGQQKFQIVLLTPHQDGTKQGRRCSHCTWSFDDLWVAFPRV